MTLEGGAHDPDRSRATPGQVTPQALFQEFLSCLPVDTMHKFESHDLLFFLCYKKKHKHEMTMPFTFSRQPKAKTKPKIRTSMTCCIYWVFQHFQEMV